MASSDINSREFTVVGKLNEDCSAILIQHHQPLKRVIQFLKDIDLEVTFRKIKDKRSDRQNRYIHGVVVKCTMAWFLEAQGEKRDHDEVYMWLRIALLGHKPKITEVLGEQVITMTGKRFSKMNTKEFEDAMTDIRQKMAERGCVIPEPRQNNFLTDFLRDE